jgi:hypothetical protein
MMSFDHISDLFRQIQPRYRWGFLLVWNGLAIGGIATGRRQSLLESPLALMLFSLAGFILVVFSFGLLFSHRFREGILIPGYSLDGFRFFLACIGFVGLLVGAGALMMWIPG